MAPRQIVMTSGIMIAIGIDTINAVHFHVVFKNVIMYRSILFKKLFSMVNMFSLPVAEMSDVYFNPPRVHKFASTFA